MRGEIGGVERLAREMVARLPALAPDRYRVIAPPRALAHRAGHLWEQVWLAARARDYPLLYSPANLAPVLYPRNAVVIHDVAALRHPEAYSPGYVTYQRRLLPPLARRARLVITVSDFSRAELAEVLGVDAVVIAEGVHERFAAAAADPVVADRHRLPPRYVLAVGTVSARKNLELLAQVAATLRREGIEIVVAGSDRGYLRGAAPGLRRLGYIPEDELPALYAGALALAMPSRYEGFGLPCLEAMAAGTPVVAAARGALPETVGDAGLLVDPDRPREFAEALAQLAGDAQLRSTLIARGRARAGRYSWSATVQRTDAALVGALPG